VAAALTPPFHSQGASGEVLKLRPTATRKRIAPTSRHIIPCGRNPPQSLARVEARQTRTQKLLTPEVFLIQNHVRQVISGSYPQASLTSLVMIMV